MNSKRPSSQARKLWLTFRLSLTFGLVAWGNYGLFVSGWLKGYSVLVIALTAISTYQMFGMLSELFAESFNSESAKAQAVLDERQSRVERTVADHVRASQRDST